MSEVLAGLINTPQDKVDEYFKAVASAYDGEDLPAALESVDPSINDALFNEVVDRLGLDPTDEDTTDSFDEALELVLQQYL